MIKTKNLEPIDLSDTCSNPFVFNYYCNTDRQVIVNMELKFGRGLEMFGLEKTSIHPYIVASNKALTECEYSKRYEIIFSTLKKYYNLVKPKNIEEWLYFKSNNKLLTDQPAWNTILPWENVSIQEKLIQRRACAIFDNKEHGSNLTIESGWRSFGPMDDKLISLETSRLCNVLCSIEKKGYLRGGQNHDVGCVVLVSEDGEVRWLTENGGQHRVATLSALGFTSIPVRVWKIIYEKDIDVWPNVLNGNFTKQNASTIFKNIFDAENNPLLDEWVNYTKNGN